MGSGSCMQWLLSAVLGFLLVFVYCSLYLAHFLLPQCGSQAAVPSETSLPWHAFWDRISSRVPNKISFHVSLLLLPTSPPFLLPLAAAYFKNMFLVEASWVPPSDWSFGTWWLCYSGFRAGWSSHVWHRAGHGPLPHRSPLQPLATETPYM